MPTTTLLTFLFVNLYLTRLKLKYEVRLRTLRILNTDVHDWITVLHFGTCESLSKQVVLLKNEVRL